MFYFYSVLILVLFCILMYDLSRKNFNHVTIFKLIFVGGVFFAIELIKNYHREGGIFAAICLMILAPWLATTDFFKKKK